MGVSNGEQTLFWRQIEELLARAREVRPLYRADALLDLGSLIGEDTTLPLLARLVEALDGWDGQLLLAMPDDALAPQVRVGDRLVIEPGATPAEGDLVLVFAAGELLVRTLAWRAGRQWLLASGGRAMPLGPEVAILGVAGEMRRSFARQATRQNAA
jgi:hypothetical protein